MPNLSISNNALGSQVTIGLGAIEQIKLNQDGTVEIPQLVVAHMIGEPFALLDNLAGVSAPDNTGAAKYIKLTAADPYNAGLLTSESVSGSAPLVVATAVISLADSPLNGLTVNLWNTERRIPRAGAAGTLENDAMQAMTGGSGHAFAYDSTGTPSGVLGAINQAGFGLTAGSAPFSRALIQFNNVGVVRTSTENRMKNQGVTYYMRIK